MVVEQERLGEGPEVTARHRLPVQGLVFLAHRVEGGGEALLPGQHEQRIGRQDLQQVGRLGKAQRKEHLGAARIGVAAHRVQEQLAPLLRQRRLRQVGGQRVQLRARHVHFARRVHRGLRQGGHRTLRGRLEFAQFLDRVEVEHRAHRVFAIAGVDVDHLALDRKLAVDGDARHAHVAERDELLLHRDRIEVAAHGDSEHPLAQVLGRRHRGDQRTQRGDQDVDPLRRGDQLGEHAGALAEHRRQRRRAGVGQQPPPGKAPDSVASVRRARGGRRNGAGWTPVPDHGVGGGHHLSSGRAAGMQRGARRGRRPGPRVRRGRGPGGAPRRQPAAGDRLRGQAQVVGEQARFLLGRRHHHQRPIRRFPQPVQQNRGEAALHSLDRGGQLAAGNPPQQLPRRLRARHALAHQPRELDPARRRHRRPPQRRPAALALTHCGDPGGGDRRANWKRRCSSACVLPTGAHRLARTTRIRRGQPNLPPRQRAVQCSWPPVIPVLPAPPGGADGAQAVASANGFLTSTPA